MNTSTVKIHMINGDCYSNIVKIADFTEITTKTILQVLEENKYFTIAIQANSIGGIREVIICGEQVSSIDV